eukprot:XP_019928044.1 PREDICTED: scavenger receptor class F member 2-like [Crassostrea gigas]
MCLNQFFILFPTEFWMQMFTNDHLMFIALLEIMLGNISIGPDPGISYNVSHGDPLTCCRNYRIADNSCKECPPGSFGIDCQEKCPPQFYGRFCREKCSCDKITGCLKVKTMNNIRVSKENGQCVNVSNGEALECCTNNRYAGSSCDGNSYTLLYKLL